MTIQDLLQKLHSWEQVEGYSKGELNMLGACILEIESYAESQCESAQEDTISRQAALDDAHRQIWYRMNQQGMRDRIDEWLKNLPSAEPETKEIGYTDCANAMLKMWMDEVITDGEYNRIMDKLNARWK